MNDGELMMVKSGDAMRGVPAFFFEGWESRSAMVGHSAGGAWVGKEKKAPAAFASLVRGI